MTTAAATPRENIDGFYNFKISKEFLDDSKLCQSMPKGNRSGPHAKHKRFKRQNEVCRLHLEYGYSARKIAEMMNINRNTVNSDLSKLNQSILRSFGSFDMAVMFLKHYYRQQSHRTRLRERLDATKSEKERLALERMIMNMDYRMPLLLAKIFNSHERIFEGLVRHWNSYSDKNNLSFGFFTSREITQVSKTTRDKIQKLINEDRRNLGGDYEIGNGNRRKNN